MVRLRRSLVRWKSLSLLISIPQWFDWDHFPLRLWAFGLHNFHSTMVRLRRGADTAFRGAPAVDFHSTMVRLRPGRVGKTDRRSTKFPFHNGSIETRWKRNDGGEIYSFPFHNGSIETDSLYRCCKPLGKFPFHNGSIETIIKRRIVEMDDLNFHSTMVRLRPNFHTVIFLYFYLLFINYNLN